MRYLGMLVLLAAGLTVATACDQSPSSSPAPQNQPNAAPTSSDRKETHPEQPTGQPQSGEGKQVPAAP
jgi:hypothetical protein